MKALNRAIARTVSQIARHYGDGCRVPMIMALENHLDALLTMERKMLEGVRDVDGPAPNYSWFTPEQGMTYGSWYEKEKEQPAPDVVDMTDPANWQVGDVLVRIAPTFGAEFQQCCEYVVASVSHYNKMVCIYRHDGGTRAYQFDLLRRDKPFQWIRHG